MTPYTTEEVSDVSPRYGSTSSDLRGTPLVLDAPQHDGDAFRATVWHYSTTSSRWWSLSFQSDLLWCRGDHLLWSSSCLQVQVYHEKRWLRWRSSILSANSLDNDLSTIKMLSLPGICSAWQLSYSCNANNSISLLLYGNFRSSWVIRVHMVRSFGW